MLLITACTLRPSDPGTPGETAGSEPASTETGSRGDPGQSVAAHAPAGPVNSPGQAIALIPPAAREGREFDAILVPDYVPAYLSDSEGEGRPRSTWIVQSLHPGPNVTFFVDAKTDEVAEPITVGDEWPETP
ncbi:MAG: hypothetical protein AB2385_06425 [Symbiobacterium sp.]|uniref:hypothetical protein n=1 Tax=Symbiobacterium sp. TaxID=1971213 RepID=UPI0034645318